MAGRYTLYSQNCRVSSVTVTVCVCSYAMMDNVLTLCEILTLCVLYGSITSSIIEALTGSAPAP